MEEIIWILLTMSEKIFDTFRQIYEQFYFLINFNENGKKRAVINHINKILS